MTMVCIHIINYHCYYHYYYYYCDAAKETGGRDSCSLLGGNVQSSGVGVKSLKTRRHINAAAGGTGREKNKHGPKTKVRQLPDDDIYTLHCSVLISTAELRQWQLITGGLCRSCQSFGALQGFQRRHRRWVRTRSRVYKHTRCTGVGERRGRDERLQCRPWCLHEPSVLTYL